MISLVFILSACLSFFSCLFVIKKLALETPQRTITPGDANVKKKCSSLGGACMFVSFLVPIFILLKYLPPSILPIIFVAILSFFIGFIDDFVKIKSGKWSGISAKMKMFLQILSGILVFISIDIFCPWIRQAEFYAWLSGSEPIFTLKYLLFLPFFVLIFVSTLNAANLTDGLDGLAGKQFFAIFLFLILLTFSNFAKNIVNTSDLQGIRAILFILLGVVVGFLLFNSNPANIIMGDSGAMMLAGVIATCFTIFRIELLLPIVCAVFVCEAASVIIQVFYFKKTGGKRVFKMTPIHHHFQLSGMKEQKIADIAFLITILISFVLIFA